MLKITVNKQELWDEVRNEFIYIPETTLVLEHSLVSVSKWEAKHHKPYLSRLEKDKKTNDEIIDYIKCMTITQNVSDYVYKGLTIKDLKAIQNYIDEPMTATTINEQNTTNSRKPVTSEVIYYWMIRFNIPVEFQKWHLNRLLTLVQVCSIYEKGESGKKMSAREVASRNAALNAARRRHLNSSG